MRSSVLTPEQQRQGSFIETSGKLLRCVGETAQKSVRFSAAAFGHLGSSDWATSAEESEHVRCSDGLST
jgi:hypothetical protein